MPFMWFVFTVAGICIAAAYIATIGVSAYLEVNRQKTGKKMFVCDKHGPVEKYTVLEGPMQWETAEGARRRGPVEICVLCFEEKIKEAKSKLPPIPGATGDTKPGSSN